MEGVCARGAMEGKPEDGRLPAHRGSMTQAAAAVRTRSIRFPSRARPVYPRTARGLRPILERLRARRRSRFRRPSGGAVPGFPGGIRPVRETVSVSGVSRATGTREVIR